VTAVEVMALRGMWRPSTGARAMGGLGFLLAFWAATTFALISSLLPGS